MSFYSELAQFSDNVCLRDEEGNTLSYAQILAACAPLESILKSRRSLVLLYARNSADAVIGYLAALRSNAVVMLVNAKLPQALTEALQANYQPNYVWCPSEDIADIDGASAPVYRGAEYALLKTCDDQHELHQDLGLMLSTSGSTGSPKFVRLSYANIQANAESIASYLELDQGQRAITTLPMAYSYGLSVVNSHLSCGAQILQTDSSLMTKEFWRLFDAGQATSIAGVPYTYEMLKRLRFFRRDLSSLQYMTQAGGRLSADLTQEFAQGAIERGIRFYTMYGQTEATARIAYVPHDSALNKCGSIGLAIPDGELCVLNEQGQDVSDSGAEGELVYRGPNVMMGYAQSLSDLSLDDSLDGVLPTGDLGYIDNDGFAFITGRLKRFIKLFGNRVNLDEIDRFAASINIDAVAGGEDDLLRIAITDASMQDELKQQIVSTFEFDHRAVEVFSVSEIPRNASGKILYTQLFSGDGDA